MPDLLNRVKSLPSICGIEFAFSGKLLPSAIEGYQQFYNSIPQETDFRETYAGKASINFDEESITDNPGISYKHKLSIKFPVTDLERANRIALMHKVKFIKVKLSNGRDLVLGRNDFEQNARIKVKTKVDERLAQAEFEILSIAPAGFIPSFGLDGLPVLFPINFINPE